MGAARAQGTTWDRACSAEQSGKASWKERPLVLPSVVVRGGSVTDRPLEVEASL